MKLNQRQVQHLLLRAGFGATYKRVHQYLGLSPEAIIDAELKLCSSYIPIAVRTHFAINEEMNDEEKQTMRQMAREDIKALNTKWIAHMVTTESGIEEKMAFFWHDHFACKSPNPYFMQDYLNVIRYHALGNFGDLLRAIAKTPAMLQYLNNQQNRKKAPNENFAREVMELFTLGRDNSYTEKDIANAARAFTGWGFNQAGEFVFRKNQHDDGEKSVLGQHGNLDGNDVLDILLAERKTAHYIARKWVMFFVNENGDEKFACQVGDVFYDSGYDIKTALTFLFTSKTFYRDENIGNHIKSPIELIVGFQRQLHVTIQDQQSLLYLQRIMGQMLFDPPNVAGWPDGKSWVDSATLMFRINLPEYIFRAATIQNDLEDSFDDNDNFKLQGPLRQLETTIDYTALEDSFQTKTALEIGAFLLQAEADHKPTSENFMDLIVFFTSKPEYQLC